MGEEGSFLFPLRRRPSTWFWRAAVTQVPSQQSPFSSPSLRKSSVPAPLHLPPAPLSSVETVFHSVRFSFGP